MEIEALSGLFGPRGMPPELRDRIAADMRELARDPALQTAFALSGQRVLAGTPPQFAAAIGRQRVRVQQIMHAVDLRKRSAVRF
jgi:tripartite-type tricarboxylate transporter receptor subunit TctC